MYRIDSVCLKRSISLGVRRTTMIERMPFTNLQLPKMYYHETPTRFNTTLLLRALHKIFTRLFLPF